MGWCGFKLVSHGESCHSVSIEVSVSTTFGASAGPATLFVYRSELRLIFFWKLKTNHHANLTRVTSNNRWYRFIELTSF